MLIAEPGWGCKETPWLREGSGQRVGDAGPPQTGEVSLPEEAAHTSLFPSPGSARRASAPKSKSCPLPRPAASLEDSHFWKSRLCHRSPRPSAAYHWGPSGSAHLLLARLSTFRMVLRPTKRTTALPMAWAQTEARRISLALRTSN